MTRLRVAVDVGGTFTDICVLDEDTGAMSVAKVPSTPADPIDAVIDGVRTAAEVDLRDVTVFSHGIDGRHERPDHAHLPARRDGHDDAASAT